MYCTSSGVKCRSCRTPLHARP
ncbi:MAG: hypothetical protein EOP50_10765 [Sphingobacteriales bacterium]|nr:MAG: hypothetical protein EOP50_10765 [Sphingobacteriales bacterium]